MVVCKISRRISFGEEYGGGIWNGGRLCINLLFFCMFLFVDFMDFLRCCILYRHLIPVYHYHIFIYFLYFERLKRKRTDINLLLALQPNNKPSSGINVQYIITRTHIQFSIHKTTKKAKKKRLHPHFFLRIVYSVRLTIVIVITQAWPITGRARDHVLPTATNQRGGCGAGQSRSQSQIMTVHVQTRPIFHGEANRVNSSIRKWLIWRQNKTDSNGKILS